MKNKLIQRIRKKIKEFDPTGVPKKSIYFKYDINALRSILKSVIKIAKWEKKHENASPRV